MSASRRGARAVAEAISGERQPSIWRRIGRAIIGALGRSGGDDKLSLAAPYKAAGPSRANADWVTTSAGPNTVVAQSRVTLVARSRDERRNNPYAARIVNVWVNNVVATGIPPRAKHDGTAAGIALAAQADAVWAKAAKKGVLDLSGQLTQAGQQRQQCASAITDGEVYCRRVFDPTADLGIRVEVCEADMLDESLSGHIAEGGNRIVQGIELNGLGRIVAYWFRPSHPGESSFGSVSGKSIRVPEVDVIHLRLPFRPGQVRSVPLLAPVMMTAKNLRDFEEFTLIQKKTESLIVGAIERAPYSEWNPAPEPSLTGDGDTSEPDPLVGGVIDADGNRVGTMRPGTYVGLDYGEKMVFSQTQLANNYDVFKRTHLQAMAVGSGCSYEQASGDFANANYSTMRGGLLEFWSSVNAFRDDFIAAEDRKWRWVMEAAWLKGMIDSHEVEAEWQAPGRQSIEPDKDAIAATILVRNGWVDEDDVIAEQGYHPETLRKKIRDNRVARQKYGIISDADPELQSWRGSTPNQSPLAASGSEPPKGGS